MISLGIAGSSNDRIEWSIIKTPKSDVSVDAMAGKCKKVVTRLRAWLTRDASGRPFSFFDMMSRWINCMNRLILSCRATRSGRLLDAFKARASVM